MTRMIELGVTIPSGGADFSRERIARVAEAARELGYDHVWAGEHLVTDSTTATTTRRTPVTWCGVTHIRFQTAALYS
jgi:alkanesulfonate monooxygenase SsuD/methylene tetrahydromethanopterin reductase-like flavin-dependent oxidoreductase (luciferase family)